MQSPSHRSGVLLACKEWMESIDDLNSQLRGKPENRAGVAGLRELGQVFLESVRGARKASSDVYDDDDDDENSTSSRFKIILHLMGLTENSLQAPLEQFFSNEQLDANIAQSQFICYRFDAFPGQVIKSFMAFVRLGDHSAGLRYAHFLPIEGKATRQTRGTVLAFENTVTLIGSVNLGDGLEGIVFKKDRSAHEIYDGLILTLSLDAEPIVSRMIMVRTDHPNDSAAGAGVYSVEDLDPEEIEILSRARNRLKFDLEREVKLNGRRMKQASIVAEVANFFTDAKGDPTLLFEDDSPFNPADHEDYTFNSALSIAKSDGR